MKRLFVLAGANGSGKSTLASVLLPTEGVVFVNPDDLARQLNPSAPEKAKVAAGKMALTSARRLIADGASFAIESTLSGRAHAGIIREAIASGYDVTIGYVFVDTPELCINRIAVRVRAGGHFVPDEDVRRRYRRSKENFVRIYQALCNHWMLYYNGGAELQLVAHGNGDVFVLDEDCYEKFMEGVCQIS